MKIKSNVVFLSALLSLLFYNDALSQEERSLQLIDFTGKWYIIQTDFPMWLSGKRMEPTFNYSVYEKEETVLSDQVIFQKNGKEKSIKGFDYPTNSSNTEFVWRGKGLLRLLKSKWEVVYMSPKKEWAIIYFEKTLFTPKGYDVIAREKNQSTKQTQSINLKLNPNYALRTSF